MPHGKNVAGAIDAILADAAERGQNVVIAYMTKAEREQLEELLKKIDEQGARLTNTPTYDELKEYRSLVKEFVGEAVSRMYSLHTSAGWDRMGRQKVYTTVRKIDRELENMAEDIRLGQADALSIVASQDAIRGMLVDLYS